MKTVINILTGDVLFAIDDSMQVDLKENEQVIDAVCDLPFDSETQKQVYNSETQSFEIVNK